MRSAAILIAFLVLLPVPLKAEQYTAEQARKLIQEQFEKYGKDAGVRSHSRSPYPSQQIMEAELRQILEEGDPDPAVLEAARSIGKDQFAKIAVESFVQGYSKAFEAPSAPGIPGQSVRMPPESPQAPLEEPRARMGMGGQRSEWGPGDEMRAKAEEARTKAPQRQAAQKKALEAWLKKEKTGPAGSIEGAAGIKFGEEVDSVVSRLGTRCEKGGDLGMEYDGRPVVVCSPGPKILDADFTLFLWYGADRLVEEIWLGCGEVAPLVIYGFSVSHLCPQGVRQGILSALNQKYGDLEDFEEKGYPGSVPIDWHANYQVAVWDGGEFVRYLNPARAQKARDRINEPRAKQIKREEEAKQSLGEEAF